MLNFCIVAVLLVVLIKLYRTSTKGASSSQALILIFNMMHRLPFPDYYKRSNSISTIPMSISNVNVCIFDFPGQFSPEIVGYTSLTANLETCTQAPGHGACVHSINLTSPHCPAAIGGANRIVTSARPRAITCCGDASTVQANVQATVQATIQATVQVTAQVTQSTAQAIAQSQLSCHLE